MIDNKSAFYNALLSIEWPFNEKQPVLRCPLTGQVIAAGYDPATGNMPEEYEDPDWSSIPTVLFHYIEEVGDFDYIHPDLQARIDDKRSRLGDDQGNVEELDDFDILSDHLESIGQVPVVFAITTSGMANGPISSTVYVGLDLFKPFAD